MAGGFAHVRERAELVRCETIQLFSRNPRGWKAAELDETDVAVFRSEMKASSIAPVFVHAPYLPNLAAADPALVQRSIDGVALDLERCRLLGVGYLVVHVGRAGDAPEAAALARVARNINRALAASPGPVLLLLENTAGMGSEVGHRFEQLGAVIRQVEDRDRMGAVLDTAHAFEAGYDLRSRPALDQALREFDEHVGLGRLHLIHLNDSKTELGSHVDRHWHIGQGRIGRDGLKLVVNHPLLRHLPAVMETPRKSDADDRRNMRAARRLVEDGGTGEARTPGREVR